MTEPRVVPPKSRRIPISNDGWLLVRDRLNAGENKQMIRRSTVLQADGTLQTDPLDAGTAKVCAFLLDWSLEIPLRGDGALPLEAALDSIDPDSYTEILRAIEAHEIAMAAERDAQKKILAGAPTSSPPSPSPAPVVAPSATETSESSTSTSTTLSSRRSSNRKC